MDEKLRRLWAASEAATLGQRGVKIVAFATGLSPKTIRNGIKELQTPLADLSQVPKNSYSPKRSRKTGGGRKKLSETDSTLIQDLEKLIDPANEWRPTISSLLDIEKYFKISGCFKTGWASN